ncbi:unnamed protein product [Trifolium pratense]|uniref:Uncharacterized protein n=1 Tax=Trifolium pratense TaxID=57577 RepID=A0ACB0KQN5_TRIPR|nr:unnamed protein product [Trifolium pratense]
MKCTNNILICYIKMRKNTDEILKFVFVMILFCLLFIFGTVSGESYKVCEYSRDCYKDYLCNSSGVRRCIGYRCFCIYRI